MSPQMVLETQQLVSFDITVTDGEAPSIDCPTSPIAAASMGGCAFEVPDFSVTLTVSDNCTASPSISQSISGGTAITGATDVTVDVTDEAGNTTQCVVSLEIPAGMSLSTTSTDASCPATADGSATVTITGGTAPFTIAWSNGAATELNENLAPGMYDVDVTDANGCTGSASVVIAGADTTDPIADCQNSITVLLDENGMASITAADINDDSSDDCGIASMTATPLAFNCSDVGANTVTLTVTDGFRE